MVFENLFFSLPLVTCFTQALICFISFGKENKNKYIDLVKDIHPISVAMRQSDMRFHVCWCHLDEFHRTWISHPATWTRLFSRRVPQPGPRLFSPLPFPLPSLSSPRPLRTAPRSLSNEKCDRTDGFVVKMSGAGVAK